MNFLKTMTPWPSAASLLLLFACTSVAPEVLPEDRESEAYSKDPLVPWHVAIPPAPDPGLAIETPIYRIPSETEQMHCMFGTFEEDLAIQTYEYFHNPTFGHATVVRGIKGARRRPFPTDVFATIWIRNSMTTWDLKLPSSSPWNQAKSGVEWSSWKTKPPSYRLEHAFHSVPLHQRDRRGPPSS